MGESKKLHSHCFFCKSVMFALPHEGYKPHHGSFIVCANCGQENDFTALFLTVKENALNMAKEMAKQKLQKQLKQAFRGNQYFKLR